MYNGTLSGNFVNQENFQGRYAILLHRHVRSLLRDGTGLAQGKVLPAGNNNWNALAETFPERSIARASRRDPCTRLVLSHDVGSARVPCSGNDEHDSWVGGSGAPPTAHAEDCLSAKPARR